MNNTIREAVRQRFALRCGYCGVAEHEVGSLLTVDHFCPLSSGGTDDLTNLVYACYACNSFKHDWWGPDAQERLLHPINDDLAAHLQFQSDGSVTGITPAGRFHVELLHLNRPALIAHRLIKQRTIDKLKRLAEIAQETETIIADFREMGFHVPEA